MDMEAALRARIVALATAAVGRVYWVERPQGEALPSITLQVISGDHPYIHSGLESTRVSRVQLDVWSSSYAEAKAIADAVIAGLAVGETSNGITFEPVRFDGERDGLEKLETLNVYRRSLDLLVWHHPA